MGSLNKRNKKQNQDFFETKSHTKDHVKNKKNKEAKKFLDKKEKSRENKLEKKKRNHKIHGKAKQPVKAALPEKEFWKAGNMLYPLPAVMVSCADGEKSDIITVAWTGTICTNPAMVYISVRPERYSYDLIKNSGEFTINLTTKKLTYAMDFCGVRSGRDLDKWKEMELTQGKGNKINAPFIMESPVNIECRVTQILELGSHHMFLAKVEGVHVNKDLLDNKGKLCLEKADLTAYSHGIYYDLGKMIGSFGYSVKK